ncbi:related to galactose oxidase precursor [Rhynchosporium agropyri]|uniref:Related to galactose oxidase n=2 Tax=Rhynchosporium TaxID=38037 RepID=A0A1E1MVP0_RHYSE|nr:related to galactose oxidase precursor [Rhynchosporium agropyri]CZT53127.1 related to galactose oxidase precursor [Rhynchosporium secalis]
MSDERKVRGQWADKFDLWNVAIHVHLLPTGEVLYWGRRAQPGAEEYTSLNEHKTHAYILDLETCVSRCTATDPKTEDDLTVNLFCSGHTFQPDGTLLVVGGHVLDGFGEDQTCIYDPFQDTWTAKPLMVQGRWYPTAITLSDGRGLVVSGSSQDVVNPVINLVPQVWDAPTDTWSRVQSPLVDIFALYPRLYHCPDGRVFMAGPLARSRFLDMNADGGRGEWSSNDKSPIREACQREYAASTMYDSGKIIYIGGGGGDEIPPTNAAEIIDLNIPTPVWRATADIGKGRRHSFATTLPDGTVIVTGGTCGEGFNDLREGMPVHEPELWDPATGEWTVMAPEEDDRCYHHTALLLPDGRVLSAGSGEYDPGNQKVPNPPVDSKITAQIFSPPYLFKGRRPTVSNSPSEIDYDQQFSVTIGQDDEIAKVSWTRIGSVTHSHNMNQSFQFLKFTKSGTVVTIDAPKNHYLAPPGHYMLFLVSKEGVPAVAPIVLLKLDSLIPQLPQVPPVELPSRTYLGENVGVSVNMRNRKAISEQDGPPVVVGLTATCPYGLGPCWGGAYEALNNIKDIKTVLPRPNQINSIAFVYLHEDILPNIDVWRKELRELDGGTYTMRGIEMTLTGVVTEKDRKLTLAGTSTRSDVILNPFKTDSKLEWNNVAKVPQPLAPGEAIAYSQLYKKVVSHPEGLMMKVTGRLQMDDNKVHSLDVKSFAEPSDS